MTVRRALARIAIATAATIAVVTVVSYFERGGGAGEIDVEVDVSAIPDAGAVEVHLFDGRDEVGSIARPRGSSLRGPIHLRAPALGDDGQVQIRLETAGGVHEIRRPLTAAGGSTVTIRVGE